MSGSTSVWGELEGEEEEVEDGGEAPKVGVRMRIVSVTTLGSGVMSTLAILIAVYIPISSVWFHCRVITSESTTT